MTLETLESSRNFIQFYHLLRSPRGYRDGFDDDYRVNKTCGNEVHPHPFQMKRWTVSARFLPAPRSGLWNIRRTIGEVELTIAFSSPRYLPFWSCPAWRLAKHNLSGLLNSVTWRKKTPVASQLRPLWGEKSSWQPLNCCNAVWPTLIPNQFLPWLQHRVLFDVILFNCFTRVCFIVVVVVFYLQTHLVESRHVVCLLFARQIYKCTSACFILLCEI